MHASGQFQTEGIVLDCGGLARTVASLRSDLGSHWLISRKQGRHGQLGKSRAGKFIASRYHFSGNYQAK